MREAESLLISPLSVLLLLLLLLTTSHIVRRGLISYSRERERGVEALPLQRIQYLHTFRHFYGLGQHTRKVGL